MCKKRFALMSSLTQVIKDILGKRGNFYPDDVIDIILEKRECADFIALRAVFFFFGEGVSDGFPSDCGNEYYESNYGLQPFIGFYVESS